MTHHRCFFLFLNIKDWFVPSPALKIPAEGLALNKDQIRETLNYFREYNQTYHVYLKSKYEDVEDVSKNQLGQIID